jgi:hypothetical protein
MCQPASCKNILARMLILQLRASTKDVGLHYA